MKGSSLHSLTAVQPNGQLYVTWVSVVLDFYISDSSITSSSPMSQTCCISICCVLWTRHFFFCRIFLNEFREQLFLDSCLPSFSFAHIGGGECIPAVPGGVCISLVQAAARQCLIMGKMQPASFFLSSLLYFCQEHRCATGIRLAHQLLLSLPRIFGCKGNLSKSLPLVRSALRTEVSPEISFVKLGHSTVELL